MPALLATEGFVFIWLGLLLLMSVGVSWVFLWAVRARQFSDQDRARYLPLQSGIPVSEPSPAPAAAPPARETRRGNPGEEGETRP